MSDSLHAVRFPGESDEYRTARNELLRAEVALRAQMQEVAALRRQLPPGGPLEKDYVFEELVGDDVRETRLSELFENGKKSLIVYSFMYGPNAEQPCAMCSSFLQSADASTPDVTQRANFVVIAKSPIHRIRDWAEERGWNNLRLLSSNENTYNADYHGESPEGHQWPACNVFVQTSSGVRHFYSSEILFAALEESLDGHPRHLDLMWPIWNFLDLTPEGRGTDWMPPLHHDASRTRASQA